MKAKIAVLPGDGIGPEVTEQAVKVLRAIGNLYGHSFELENGLIGAAAIDATGNPFPLETETLCRKSDAILFGAIGHPKYDNDPNAKIRPEQGLLAMRKRLGLYANIRPVTAYKALSSISPLKEEIVDGVDFVVFRELTGGIYFGEPRGRSENGFSAFDTCNYNKEEIQRVSKLAFETAMNRKKRLTLVDKANVLATSRLWRETVTEMAKDYPEIELEYMFVDNAAMQLIQRPKDFDVVVTENMFGDIITDEASVIPGSLGLLPSASVGKNTSLFEPIHGSYPQAAGKNIANPIGAILSAAMMLEHSFQLLDEAKMIRQAVDQAISSGKLTEDLSPKVPTGTNEVGDHIVSIIRSDQWIHRPQLVS
ncbi:3-isopropylmalate dehydrogenase [Xanthovirga aplysinae]|uniref:3-isopropylmalate dehydrogenase n=1 Tax=Xanthovirga aplysinae TaxID=2529853 RepID=UPI0012BC7666|nr:3-isopropylmalate dehydrogenase [Xanthovirga aplysinae]MTI33527.1 3-isopropylmalate dehydrogenase [Xanthovirga aplysinae]